MTGVAAARIAASALAAVYSMIISPELPAGPSARNGVSPVSRGSISAPSRAAPSCALDSSASRSRVERSRERGLVEVAVVEHVVGLDRHERVLGRRR